MRRASCSTCRPARRSSRSARNGARNTSAAKSSTWPSPIRDAHLPDLAGSLRLAGHGRLHGQRAVCRTVPAAAQGRAVRKGAQRDARHAVFELQHLRQHHQLEAAGGVASDRRPAVPRHHRRGVPRAEHHRPVRGPGGQRAAAAGPLRRLRHRSGAPSIACACGPTGATDIPAGGIEPTRPGADPRAWSRARPTSATTCSPEQGKSFDWGVVYDPSWLPGFSVSLDYWRLYLNDTITNDRRADRAELLLRESAQRSVPLHQPLRRRRDQLHPPADGEPRPAGHQGLGHGVALQAAGHGVGQLDRSASTAPISRSGTTTPTPASDDDAVIHLAGHYNLSYGMYSRIRARAFANWSLGDWSAGWRIRYVGPFDIGSDDDPPGQQRRCGCLHDPSPARRTSTARRGAVRQLRVHNLNVGYAMPSINSRIEVGVDNVFDKQPPLLYQNNVLNANTDVEHVRHDRPLLLRPLHRQVLIATVAETKRPRGSPRGIFHFGNFAAQDAFRNSACPRVAL